MEKPELHMDSVLCIIEAMTIQKRIADKISPCFTPFKISTDLEIPTSSTETFARRNFRAQKLSRTETFALINFVNVIQSNVFMMKKKKKKKSVKCKKSVFINKNEK